MTFASARTSMLTTCISAIANRNLRNSVGQGSTPTTRPLYPEPGNAS